MQAWTIIGSQDEESFFDDHIRAVLAQDRQSLPAREQQIGSITARWEAVGPRSAFVQAVGGSPDDRLLARAVLAAQLVNCGWREASWVIDDFRKEATWDDIVAKAKRLIQSGKVKLLRNGYQNVVAQVQGDHGTYQCEIFRQDPSSRAITGSDCECDWGEFQNQPRTRQWKKFQDRPCSHVLAAYWTSLATPLDEDAHPDSPAGGQGQQQTFPAGTEGFGQDPSGGGLDNPGAGPSRLAPAAPSGQLSPDQMSLMPQGAGGPQAPAQAVPGPSPRDVLPQFPMEGLAQGQINPASVPGARGPSPTNPVNYPAGPGGALSSVRRGDEEMPLVQQLQTTRQNDWPLVQLRYDDQATLEGRSEAHGAGQEATIPAGSVGEIRGYHPGSGLVNVLWMGKQFDQNGRMQPFGASGWHFPSFLVARHDLRHPGPAIRRSV